MLGWNIDDEDEFDDEDGRDFNRSEEALFENLRNSIGDDLSEEEKDELIDQLRDQMQDLLSNIKLDPNTPFTFQFVNIDKDEIPDQLKQYVSKFGFNDDDDDNDNDDDTVDASIIDSDPLTEEEIQEKVEQMMSKYKW